LRCSDRSRACYAGVGRADRKHFYVSDDDTLDNAINDNAAFDDDHAFLGDDAELESIHARSRHNTERPADPGQRQSNVADRTAETGIAKSGNDPAVVNLSSNRGRYDQPELRADDPAGHAALIAKAHQEKGSKMMKLKSLALCGASIAFVTLGTTASIADPAAGDPYTQNPTPQERAQTQQLNSRASDDAVQSTSAVQDQNDANQAQYDAQQQQYQNDQDRYEAQKDRYLDQRAEYEYDRSHPYAWWHDRYTAATLNHFYDIPRTELIDLRVMREDGYTVGRIREIDRHGDGRVSAVRVVFRDGESAWVKARDLRYDPDDRIVFTNLSVIELHDLARNS
jgi:hypothetical protein